MGRNKLANEVKECQILLKSYSWKKNDVLKNSIF